MCATRASKIRQLTDVLQCKLQHYFLATGTEHFSTTPGPRPIRIPMNAMAPTRPTELQVCRVRLTASPAAAGEARGQVRAAIRAWDIPVDPDIAVLLTSELVTNAIGHEAGETITLAVTCSFGQLRVDVHDTSRTLPVLVDASADAEAGRGLMLVASLSATWGIYRTPAGKAVYFTLAFEPGPPEGNGRAQTWGL
jgi:anti-sigma regulatory factor (Ser/Thr protein kinase)